MYNRYIPQNDGTYRKSRMDEPFSQPPPRPRPKQTTQEQPCAPQKEDGPCNPQIPNFLGVDVGNFLKRLLPANLDTGDLLIIVLLLLMAGECAEDKTSALLTLALYLFM